MFAAFRSLRPIVLGLLSAGAGILAATLALLLVDGELHLVTLAFGASLIGEAIDYAILFCAAHLAARQSLDAASWAWRRCARRSPSPLRPACSPTALLGLLPFPGVSQVARFALVGLAVAWLSVQWLLPGLLMQPSRRDPALATGWAARLLERLACGAERAARRGHRRYRAARLRPWVARAAAERRRAPAVPRQPELASQDAAIRATDRL